MAEKIPDSFKKELTTLINKYSLKNYNDIYIRRNGWYDK